MSRPKHYTLPLALVLACSGAFQAQAADLTLDKQPPDGVGCFIDKRFPLLSAMAIGVPRL